MKERIRSNGSEQTGIAACPGVKNCLAVVTFQAAIKGSSVKDIWRKLRAKLAVIVGREVISVHCCIPTEMIRLMLLEFSVLYKLIKVL